MHMTWFRCFRQTFRKVSDFKHEQWVQIAHGHGHSTLEKWLQIVHRDCAMDCFSAFFPALKDVVVLVGKVLWTFCLLLARCCPGSVPECIWTKPFVSNMCSYLRIGWTFVGAWASSFMGSISGDGFENGWRSQWSRMWNKGWTLSGTLSEAIPGETTVLPGNLSNLHSSFAKDFE